MTTLADVLSGRVDGYIVSSSIEDENGVVIFAGPLWGSSESWVRRYADGELQGAWSPGSRQALENGTLKIKRFESWEHVRDSAEEFAGFNVTIYQKGDRFCINGSPCGTVEFVSGRPSGGSGGSTFVLNTYQRRDGSSGTRVLYGAGERQS